MSVLLPSASYAQVAGRAVLQLKWEHEFQYAGYYAALWQDYYAAQGIDVEIRSAFDEHQHFKSPVDEVLAGNADFGVGGIDILSARGRGEKIVVLTPILQNSPMALFSLDTVPINTLRELSALRIAAEAGDYTRELIQTMFLSVGIDTDAIEFVDEPASVKTLQEGRADAIASYDVSVQHRASELGISLNMLSPSDYGINFYGDVLFTTEDLIAREPEMVRGFVRASLEGWHYAMRNKIGIADRISAELPRYVYDYQDIKAYNRAFAQRMDDYLMLSLVPLGHNQIERWQNAYLLLRQLGLIEQEFAIDDLFASIENTSVREGNGKRWLIVALSLSALFTVLFLARTSQARVLLVTAALFVAGEQFVEARYHALLTVEQRASVAEKLSAVRYQIESHLSNNLSLINGLAAFIASDPSFTEQEFETYAATVLERTPTLVNLSGAPDLVVRYIFPLRGSESVIGLDYREQAEQYDAVRRAVLTDAMVIAGPVDLVQGGTAFIGRAPVYINDGFGGKRFWGIVSAPISTANIYAASNLFDPSTGLEIAIRGRDGLGAQGSVFFGQESVFDNPNAVVMPVVLGGGTWQIAAYDLRAASNTSSGIVLLRIAALILCALVLIVIFLRSRAKLKEEAYEQLIFRNEQFLREVETVSRVGGWRLNNEGVFTEVSRQCMQIFGVSSGAGVLTLKEVCEQYTHATAKTLSMLIERAKHNNHSFDTELYLERLNKEESWLHIRGEMRELPGGQRELVGAIQDITKAKAADRLIEYQANYDGLTGLANRSLLRDRLDSALAMSRRANTKLAVVFIDLDNFKLVNDNLGHDVGDEVLVKAAMRIKRCVREVDTVARYSGDEFIVVLRDVSSESAVCRIVDDIVATIGRVYTIANHQVYCGASIGIAFYPNDALDSETLIIKADQAMYEVKKSGRNGWQFYTQELQRKSERRHNFYNELVEAVNKGNLSVYYQPIYDLKLNRIVGCEALVRWRRADGSFVSPDEFIPLAEESGLVIRIDHFVLKTARDFISALNTEHGLNMYLAVNVSARLLYMRDESSQAWFAEIKSPANVSIVVEITERLLVEDATRALEVLNDLRASGIEISIDDFGTGYSGLSYLSSFPVNAFKIDRSFVAKIGQLQTEEALIETMLLMADKLKVKVIAEGVETPEQLDFLRALNCDFAQGYYVAKPMPSERFQEYLLKGAARSLYL